MKSKRPESWLHFKDRIQWREWLENHHDKDTSIWIEIKKARSNSTGIYLGEAVEEAICFGWIDGKMFSVDQDRYIIRMTPRRPGSVWSKINRDRAVALINSWLMREPGMEAIRIAQANGQWQKAYSSKETPDLPEDLLEALKNREGALANFNGWTNSLQLQAIFWLDQSKRSKTRMERIARIVNAAANNSPIS